MPWADYNQLGNDLRGEFIDGALLMAPTPDRHHQDAIQHVLAALSAVCLGDEGVTTGWGWSPAGVDEEYVPDVMMVPATHDEARFGGIPLLCVEVTSSNRANDLVLKRAKYAAASLPDYWVVDRQDHLLRTFALQGKLLVEVEQWRPPGRHRIPFGGREVELDLDLLLRPVRRG